MYILCGIKGYYTISFSFFFSIENKLLLNSVRCLNIKYSSFVTLFSQLHIFNKRSSKIHQNYIKCNCNYLVHNIYSGNI